MLDCQNHHFNLPDEVAYLNCSYMSPTPSSVELAGLAGVAKKRRPFEIGIPDFFDPVARLKQQFAALVNVPDHNRIAIVPSVSYGMANVAKNVRLEPGQNIVLVDEIFPSNFYPWKRLADEAGAEVRTISPASDDEGRGASWNHRLLEAMDRHTALVAVPHAHWADGTRFDLAAVRRRSKELGALMVVDGTQSVGALPFDVQELQPDALVCAGYKWLLGPYSLGLAYYGPHFDNGTPIEENWINRLHSEDFQQLVNYQPEYKPAAHRYCMGENSQFIAVPMLSAALDLLLDWEPARIQAYCTALSAPFIDAVADMGCQVEQPAWRCGHIFGVRLPAGASLDSLKSVAAEHKVYVSFRGDSIRVSPNVYNRPVDFDRLLDVFKTCL